MKRIQKGYKRYIERAKYDNISLKIHDVENCILALYRLFNDKAGNIPDYNPFYIDSPYYKYKIYKPISYKERSSFISTRIYYLLFDIKVDYQSFINKIIDDGVKNFHSVIILFDILRLYWKEIDSDFEYILKNECNNIEIKVFIETLATVHNNIVYSLKKYVHSHCKIDNIPEDTIQLIHCWDTFMEHLAFEFTELTNPIRSSFLNDFQTIIENDYKSFFDNKAILLIKESETFLKQKANDKSSDFEEYSKITKYFVEQIKARRLSLKDYTLHFSEIVEKKKNNLEETEMFLKKQALFEKLGIKENNYYFDEQKEFENSIILTPMGGSCKWKRRK